MAADKPPRQEAWLTDPDSKVYVANMGPIWGRQDPGGPHAVPMIFVIWGAMILAKLSSINLVSEC